MILINTKKTKECSFAAGDKSMGVTLAAGQVYIPYGEAGLEMKLRELL